MAQRNSIRVRALSPLCLYFVHIRIALEVIGPIFLFDKSFLQSLSVDESVWFNNFFICNVCPIFYCETLADLGKSVSQRAELLKQNELFLNQRESIKKRLGDKFLKLLEERMDDTYPSRPQADITESDFAEPVVVLVSSYYVDVGTLEHRYYLPGTPIGTDQLPLAEIEPIKDSLFGGFPLEWVLIDDQVERDQVQQIDIRSFKDSCKVKVFERYWLKWYEFSDRGHISMNWNGDLR